MATAIEQPVEAKKPHVEEGPGLTLRRFTPDEYSRMSDAGILAAEERTELLKGIVVAMMSRRLPHDEAILNLDEAFRPLCPADFHLRFQLALSLHDSCPEPDCAVIRGARKRGQNRFPTVGEVELIVEVSDSTLRTDQQVKSCIYARAGVPTNWIVNLEARQLEVLTEPTGDATEPAYAKTTIFKPGEKVPFTLAGTVVGEIAVADLLP